MVVFSAINAPAPTTKMTRDVKEEIIDLSYSDVIQPSWRRKNRAISQYKTFFEDD